MMITILDASMRACAIAFAVGLSLAVWRVRSGAVRHAAWAGVVIAMLALPVVPSWLPSIPLPFSPASLTTARSQVAATIKPLQQFPVPGRQTDLERPSLVPARAVAGLPAPRTPSLTWSWQQLALGLWLTVVVVFAVRLAIAWRKTARLALDAAQATGPQIGTDRVFESARVASPLTVGVWRPRILLPVEWTSWPVSTLRAALVHERAHIARRDPLVSLIAELNTCVFWFHPLAWWLRGQLSQAAEQACDDRALRSGSAPSEYAGILVEMASAVQHRGARVSWAGLGIGDPTGLERRLDRVLRGDGLREPSTWRRFGVATTCVVAIALGLACRQQPADLRPDPDTAAQLATNAERSRRGAAAEALTLQEAAALEQKVAANPDDLDTLETLFYFYRIRGQKLMGWDAELAARRALQMKLIGRHPESTLASFPDILKQYDPVGYEQARALWMAHANQPDVTATVLGNAAAFFTPSEKPVAESLLLRAAALDPAGPTPTVVNGLFHQKWVTRLGTLYAQAIVGSNDNTVFNVVKSVSVDEAHGAFASAVRAKLEASRDASLLTAAGAYLVQNARGAENQLNFDFVALGRTYLERAATIDQGDNSYAQRLLLVQQVHGRRDRMRKALPGRLDTIDDATVAALSEHDRFDFLPPLAELAYSSAENVEHSDPAQFTRLMARAHQWAAESVALAEKFRADPEYGTAVYEGHVILGTIALRNGDRRTAVDEMRLAGTARPSPTLTAGDTLGHYRLTNYLLKAGERESVAEFFEKMADLLPWQRAQLLKDAQAIRNGAMPMSYQYAFAKPS